MVEYGIDEAKTLLTDKLSMAKKSVDSLKQDLEFLREQITTMEVNIARIYNYDVKRRREQK